MMGGIANRAVKTRMLSATILGHSHSAGESWRQITKMYAPNWSYYLPRNCLDSSFLEGPKLASNVIDF